MLQRDVNVLDDLVDARDGVDEFGRKVRRIAVEQPNPAETGQLCERVQEIGEAPPVLLAPVAPVLVRVLGDQVDLAHAALDEPFRLSQRDVERLGAELAAEARDRAERARVIASLRDAEVRRVRRR